MKQHARRPTDAELTILHVLWDRRPSTVREVYKILNSGKNVGYTLVIALSSSPLLQRIWRLTEMKISKMHHVSAFCMALLAVSFIIVTAAGSILLATIPPQNSKSSASANTPSGDQDFDKAKPEARGTSATSRNKEVKYALLCGIIGVTVDKATGKPIAPPPLPKDEKDRVGGCILLDVSTKQWKYSPTLLNGKAIPVMATVVITFTFNKDGSPKITAFP